MPFFLIYGRDSHLPLHQLLEPMQWYLGDPESGLLNLEAHCLAQTIAKKTLDENCFRTAQKTMDREPPSFKIGNSIYSRNKQLGKWDLKWRPGYKIAYIKHDRHYLHIENQATGKMRSCNVKDVVLKPPVEFWNIDTIWQSWEMHQPPHKFANYHAQWLKMNTLLMYIVTCK